MESTKTTHELDRDFKNFNRAIELKKSKAELTLELAKNLAIKKVELTFFVVLPAISVAFTLLMIF